MELDFDIDVPSPEGAQVQYAVDQLEAMAAQECALLSSVRPVQTRALCAKSTRSPLPLIHADVLAVVHGEYSGLLPWPWLLGRHRYATCHPTRVHVLGTLLHCLEIRFRVARTQYSG